jgi:hypothetical protein
MATEHRHYCTASNNAIKLSLRCLKKFYCLCITSEAYIESANLSFDGVGSIFIRWFLKCSVAAILAELAARQNYASPFTYYPVPLFLPLESTRPSLPIPLIDR